MDNSRQEVDLKNLLYKLYERFLKENGDYGHQDDKINRAMIKALVGDFPAAYELIKDQQGQVKSGRALSITIESFRLSFEQPTSERKEEVAKATRLSDFELLLWRGYFEAARDHIRLTMNPEFRWPRYLELYKKTSDPGDLKLARQYVTRGQFYFGFRSIAEALLEIAKVSKNGEDLIRADNFYKKREDHLPTTDKVSFLISRYTITGDKPCLTTARGLAESAVDLDQKVAGWKMIAKKTKSKSDRQKLSQAKEELERHKEREVADADVGRLVEIARQERDRSLLLLAGQKLLALPKGDASLADISDLMRAIKSERSRHRR